MNSNDIDSKSSSALYLWAFGLIFAFCFTIFIWLLGPNLNYFVDSLLPDQGSSWYYWKLPSRDFWGMSIVWVLYLGHQFSIWIAVYFGQRDLKGFRSHSLFGLPKYSLVALSVNLFFVLLHLIQTQIWFDGLAQDTPIFTSQYSVIIMLAIVLILENPRRGLLIGRKIGKPFTSQVIGFFRRSHMYIFAWALVYTFWFHPMAADPQLISGFFYMFLLFTQVNLAWTWIHFDKKWIILLESYVTIHAVVVAVFNTSFFNSPVMWPMFFSGFAFMFVFTYIYAFKLDRRVYWLVTLTYLGFLIWLYLPTPIGYGRSILNMIRFEFLWIPIILHVLAVFFAGLTYLKIRE
ncbi:MAG: hypothetical protein GKB99_04935 [Methanocellales archaeon]|nr:hypothetical protein [Methanocellales archaeon]